MTKTATDRLLDFAAAPHRLPAVARRAAVELLADTLLCGAAGSTTEEAARVLSVAGSWGAGEEARLLAGSALPAPAAAFANAFAIHCLEWDAVHEPAVVHALSVVVATLGAVIDRRGGCDEDEALSALAVGVDIAAGLGIAATEDLRFFRPAIAGTIGAALAAARIAGVDRARLPDVLGLAHAQCAGTMQAHVEGSVALPLQIAGAARAAVAAVDLAAAGLGGPHDALEGTFGHFALFDRGDLAAYTDGLGLWRITEVSFKPYPSGRASHAILTALADLAPNPGDVASIEAHVPPLVARLVGRPMQADMTPAYARLCSPFLAGLMLTEGRIDPRRFGAPAFADKEISAAGALLRVLADDNPDPNALAPQRLRIIYRSGQVADIEIPVTPGAPHHPANPSLMAQKVRLARELIGKPADQRLFDAPLDYFIDPGISCQS